MGLTEEELNKGMAIIACVDPLIAQANFLSRAGHVAYAKGWGAKAKEFWAEAERVSALAERWRARILERPYSTESLGLKALVTTGYREDEVSTTSGV